MGASQSLLKKGFRALGFWAVSGFRGFGLEC